MNFQETWVYYTCCYNSCGDALEKASVRAEHCHLLNGYDPQSLFRDPKFVLLFVSSDIATCHCSSCRRMPGTLYADIGSVLVAVYNLSSACEWMGFSF